MASTGGESVKVLAFDVFGTVVDWHGGIVCEVTALGLDSSLDERKKLATELNYGKDTSDSAKMNIWLHRQVMTRLAANDCTVPAGLRD